MQIDILTIFPDLVYHYTSDSILNLAIRKGLVKVSAHDFRLFSEDKHHRVDERPYGGGAGMVLRPEPIYNCLESLGLVKNGKKVKQANTKVIVMDPSGKEWNQKFAAKYAKLDRLVIICGRYQGIDERVYDFVDGAVSVGDFVLSGGELAALVITESIVRLLPGVLGNEESLTNETFIAGKKSDKNLFGGRPMYTRPEIFLGKIVPEVLLSGDHGKIANWRRKQAKK